MSYVYIKSRNEQLWTVGFYAPDGEWQAESDYDSPEAAAFRVHWFNGGNAKALKGRSGAPPELLEAVNALLDAWWQEGRS